MSLSATSLDWAIEFLVQHSDGDLFPRPLEMSAIKDYKADFIALVAGKDLVSFAPNAHRRFIVPKDDVSYRQATQLHPQDSILLTAIVHQYGQGIEHRRLSRDVVFSYRFDPEADRGLYAEPGAWNKFWASAHQKSASCGVVLCCDIADFYNQVYHHTVENQLISSGFPNQITKWIIKLLESTTAGVSRGVPIGPHGAHLIAESTLIPVDNTLASIGVSFARFSDDFIIFCESENAARQLIGTIATTLDRQQRLMLQRHKTKILAPHEFSALCRQMIEDRPISKDEADLLSVVRKYSGGDPYRTVSFSQISPQDLKSFDPSIVDRVVREYVSKNPIDFIRLRWFYRRLSQIGHPGAIEISLSEIERLGPCLANICSYLASVQGIEAGRWKTIGSSLLKLLDSDEVKSQEYFRLSILSLFSKNVYINHFPQLAGKFQASDQHARREILLSAKANGAYDWLREHKESFEAMDEWQRIAFLYCLSGFPADEKKYFVSRNTLDRPFEKILAKWAKQQA